MIQTTTALRVYASGGSSYFFRPVEPYASGEAGDAWVGTDEFHADDANCLFGETTGEAIEIKLGSRTVTDDTAQAYNGVKEYSDMSLIREVIIRGVSTATTAPAWTGESSGSVTLGYLSDCGNPSGNQTAAANRVLAWSPDGILAVGDWTYNFESSGGTGANADLAVWNAEITAERFFPGMGNHEKAAGLMTYLSSKFGGYISDFTGGSARTYYEQLFYGDPGDTDPLIQVLMLDDGIETDGDLWADAACGGGLKYGSEQWAWIYDRVRSVPNARYRIACIHHPPVTSASEGAQEGAIVAPEVANLARCGWFDALLVGHMHTIERFDLFGTPVINVSSCVQSLSAPGRPLYGTVGGAELVKTSTDRAVTKIVATPDELTFQAVSLAGTVIDEFAVFPKSVPFGRFSVEITGLHMSDGEPQSGVTQTFHLPARGRIHLHFPDGHDCHSTTASIRIVTADMSAGDPGDHYCRNLKAQMLIVGA